MNIEQKQPHSAVHGITNDGQGVQEPAQMQQQQQQQQQQQPSWSQRSIDQQRAHCRDSI